jgi:hypothetical protein
MVIAREIGKGDQVVTLRDVKGFTVWSGHGRTDATAAIRSRLGP